MECFAAFVMPDSSLVQALAASFVAGEMTTSQVVARGASTLGRRWRWLSPLAQRYIEFFSGRTRPRRRDVIAFLLRDQGFLRASSKYSDELTIASRVTGPQRMQPAGPAAGWDIPPIESAGALAEWLAVDAREQQWFADLKGLASREWNSRLNHYKYQVVSKSDGGMRLIEAPKTRLRAIQRQILSGILENIPVHPAAHGFVKGRSIKSFVAPHVGQQIILRMDLKDFFPSFRAARVQSFFRTLGYPESVANLLGGICTNAVPRCAWKNCGQNTDLAQLREVRTLYSRPHLPQGAPTSPALANLLTYRLDCRLMGLARSTCAKYSRYADDLAFSGDAEFERRIERFSTHVAAILIEEGFGANYRKTRIMRRGVRQHLAGVVVNRHINVKRCDFDRLKAILTNCVRLGPESQNLSAHRQFRAHLEGRVGFVEMVNPARGSHLRKIFQQIPWRQ